MGTSPDALSSLILNGAEALQLSGHNVTVDFDEPLIPLTSEALAVAAKVIQEGVENVIRHGRSHGNCDMYCNQIGDQVEIGIVNDIGDDIQQLSSGQGFGLEHCCDLLFANQGKLETTAVADRWVFRLTIPLGGEPGDHCDPR